MSLQLSGTCSTFSSFFYPCHTCCSLPSCLFFFRSFYFTFRLFLLGSSRTGESFPLFHVLRSSSGLPLSQLNPFALCRSVPCLLGIPFPDISKLRDGASLAKTPPFVMNQVLFRVSFLGGAPVVSIPIVP